MTGVIAGPVRRLMLLQLVTTCHPILVVSEGGIFGVQLFEFLELKNFNNCIVASNLSIKYCNLLVDFV
jgi:hypothetical protein